MNWSGGCEARSITGHFQFQLHNKHQAGPRKLQHLGDVSEQIGRGRTGATWVEAEEGRVTPSAGEKEQGDSGWKNERKKGQK